jgi:paraquat-inducible protein B
MAKQASTKAIGGFVIGAIALLVAGVLIFSSGRFLKKMPTYILFFEGAMGGLNVGAPVDFRGVRVGMVKDLRVTFNTEARSVRIPVIIEMEGRVKIIGDVEVVEKTDIQELIKRGMRAQLQLQSMVTGQKKIELDFHPETPVRLLNISTEYPELPTIPSDMEKLSQTIEELPIDELFDKLLQTVEAIRGVVDSPEVKGSIQSLEQTLKHADKLVQDVDAQVKPLSYSIRKTTEAANAALKQVKKLAKNVDQQVEPTSSSIKKTTEETNATLVQVRKLIQNLDAQVEPVMSSVGKTSDETRLTLQQIKKTFAALEHLVTEDSPRTYELSKTLEELSAAARSLRTMTDYIERHPEALLRGK